MNEYEKDLENIKQTILDKISFIKKTLPFDDKYKVSYLYRETYFLQPIVNEALNIDFFVEEVYQSTMGCNKYQQQQIIVISLQDVALSFRVGVTYEDLKLYCDVFLKLARKSDRFLLHNTTGLVAEVLE